jgi:hypothetical protein
MIEVSQTGGRTSGLALPALLETLEVARRAVVPAFAAERLELVAEVSGQILKRGASQATPGVTHFAYWTRRAALKALAAEAAQRLPAGCVARPRGLVFHLPPQNVETVFLYSWAIAYLAGNANLTRLPTALGDDMAGLLDLFQTALAARGDQSQLFVRYPADEAINRALSAVSDARVVWGGDAKVAAFAPLPLRDGGKALWFGDRRSLAMVDGAAVAALDEPGRRDLAERLHNDIFVFDQLACSSPVRLFVVGDEAAHGPAVGAVLGALSEVALRRGSGPAAGHVIHKLTAAMAMAAEGAAQRVTRHSGALTSVVTEGAEGRTPVGGGFLEVAFAATPKAICPYLAENTQTLVHFGFANETLSSFAAALPPFAVTRIVPIGQALDFDVIWDGYDLIAELTRLLRVR